MGQYWEGTRVRLRAVDPADADAHHAFNQSDEYGLLDQIYPPGTLDRVQEWASRQAKAGFDDETYAFQIADLATGALAGHIATHHSNHRTGTFSYGVSVLGEHRGKGFAQEAICLVLRYYFQELRYQKVNVEVIAPNIASARLHEGLGFVLEGRRRRSAYSFGEAVDVLLYGMTAEEFRDRHPAYWRSLPTACGAGDGLPGHDATG